MPGTPPQSPRFSVPRYADGDTAQFSVQTNAITDGFDGYVARRLTPNILTGSATVADHQVVVAGASETVTLPAPSSEHELIAVYAKDDIAGVSGATPVTITVSSGKIYGKGLGTSGATSLVLGTPGAFVWLFSPDGTNWKIVHGEQDTGWVALSGGAEWWRWLRDQRWLLSAVLAYSRRLGRAEWDRQEWIRSQPRRGRRACDEYARSGRCGRPSRHRGIPLRWVGFNRPHLWRPDLPWRNHLQWVDSHAQRAWLSRPVSDAPRGQ